MADLRGPCEAFGVGCVVAKQKRAPNSVQFCKSCGKMFDVACKRAYAPACELEDECGCVNPDVCDDSPSEPEPKVSLVSRACEDFYVNHIFRQNISPVLMGRGKRHMKKHASKTMNHVSLNLSHEDTSNLAAQKPQQVSNTSFMADDVVVANDPVSGESYSARVTACLESGSLEVAIRDPQKAEESAWSPASFSGKMTSVPRSTVCLESENLLCKVSQKHATTYHHVSNTYFRIISNLCMVPPAFFSEENCLDQRSSKS